MIQLRQATATTDKLVSFRYNVSETNGPLHLVKRFKFAGLPTTIASSAPREPTLIVDLCTQGAENARVRWGGVTIVIMKETTFVGLVVAVLYFTQRVTAGGTFL